jgi:hypothetical protein
VTTNGFELGLSALVTSTVTTTPLRMSEIAADNKKIQVGLPACLQMGPGFKSPWFSF